MKRFIYAAGIPVNNEPYTFRLVGNVLAVAKGRSYTVCLKIPDSPKSVDHTLLIELIRRRAGIYDCVEFEQFSSPMSDTNASDDILFIASSFDLWRLVLRNPKIIRKYKKVFWFQGFESEESYLKRKSKIRRAILAVSESLAMKASRVIICPSDAMIETVLKRYPFLKNNTFITIPNLADVIPEPIIDPTLWGFDKLPDLVLGYSGGLAQWQCFEDTCRIAAEVEMKISDSWFFVLTRDSDKAEVLLKKNGVNRYQIRSTSTDQASKYISAFDLGFMLRRNSIVNTVACPMKWLEYWQCGVPLVTTGAVKIIDDASASKFNCVVDIDNFKESAERILTWASKFKNRQNFIRNEIVRCVKQQWRSEERRVGKECRRLCRSRWSPYH
jgi:hypothetical protein